MKKPLKILSIDWDYFIDATENERMTIFPDPHDDLPVSITTACWTSRYAENPIGNCRNLMEVGVNQKRLQQMKNYLNLLSKGRNPDIKIMVTDSHKYIYQFISKTMMKHPEFPCVGVPIKLLNIDHHSDAYGIRDTEMPDCGNWVNYLDSWLRESGRVRKFSTLQWTCNSDSSTDEDTIPSSLRQQVLIETETLDDAINKFFGNSNPDMIFLCKSGPWSPPHLDDGFDSIVNCLKSVGNIMMSNDVENRWNDDITRGINELKTAYESVEGLMNKKGEHHGENKQ
jgi:hypothetical protein